MSIVAWHSVPFAARYAMHPDSIMAIAIMIMPRHAA
jgi:hypothetical protein